MKSIRGLIKAVCESDGFEWNILSKEMALILLSSTSLEIVQLYWEDEAEGVVTSLEDFKERASCPGATFAVATDEIKQYYNRLLNSDGGE